MKNFVIYSVIVLATMCGWSAYGQSNSTFPTTNFNISQTPTSENLTKTIALIDKEIAKLKQEKNIEVAKLKLDLSKVKREQKKIKLTAPTAEISDGDTVNLSEYNTKLAKYNSQAAEMASLKSEEDSIMNLIKDVESTYDVQIGDLTINKMTAFDKLANLDSVKTFYGTSTSPMKAAYAYTMVNASNKSTNSSSSSADGSLATTACSYKGLVVNETGINGITFKITGSAGFEKSYYLGAKQSIYDVLPAGKYWVTAYNGSNIIYSEKMEINPLLTKNFKGAEVYWASYVKYVNQ